MITETSLKHISLLHDITTVFHSDIPLWLKNDCACRIICENLNADIVSIFLYHGDDDILAP